MASEETSEVKKPFIPRQLLGMGAAVATVTVVYRYGSFIPVPSSLDVAQKLGYTCKWLLLPSLNVFIAIMDSGYARGKHKAHPLANRDHLFQIQKNVLMNTLEQYAAFCLPVLALGASVQTSNQLRLIPALCGIFFVGRIFFRLGYPDKRGFGYSMNAFASVFTYAANIYLTFKYGLLGGLSL